MTCLTNFQDDPIRHPNGSNKNIDPKAELLKSIRIPKNDRDCWVWVGDDLASGRRRVYRAWHGDDKDLEIVTEGDCYHLCVNWAHLHLKPGIPVETFEPGNAGDEGGE